MSQPTYMHAKMIKRILSCLDEKNLEGIGLCSRRIKQYYDNHAKNKYIDVRFYFPKELTRDGVIELVYCGTQY
ncbi:hypothetical protein CR513_10204, partial [Mucuna pruriens]